MGETTEDQDVHGEDNGTRSPLKKRSVSRLLAVQALYQISQTGEAAQTVTQHFLEDPWKSEFEEQGLQPDPAYFKELTSGTALKMESLDTEITPLLNQGWTLERLDPTVLAILRVASFELSAMLDVPTHLVINEYVTIAHSFFEDSEPRFINAILDRVAQKVRYIPETPPEPGTNAP